MISIQQISKLYADGNSFAIKDITLEIGEGELLVLLGESGCGKSTMLKMINRLVEPTEGRILIDGNDTRLLNPVELRRSIGYVLQNVGLFPHLSVARNIGILPELLGWDQHAIDERV